MPSSTAKEPRLGQLYESIDEATVLRIVRAVNREAERTLDAAMAALKALGLYGRPDGRVFHIPIALLLKLGAMMRI